MARITVEDCLEKIPNRFELVLLGARRAKQLLKGARPLVDSDNKEVVAALREIADGKVAHAVSRGGGRIESFEVLSPESLSAVSGPTRQLRTQD